MARPNTTEQARQVLALLPTLRRWVTARVERAGADLDLSVRQYAALRGIREGASSPGELARLWQVTPAVITGIVDRLESRGLVRRELDPADRRRFRLELTATGLAVSDEIERALIADLAAELAAAAPPALAELERSVHLLLRAFAALDQREARHARECNADTAPGQQANAGPPHVSAGGKAERMTFAGAG